MKTKFYSKVRTKSRLPSEIYIYQKVEHVSVSDWTSEWTKNAVPKEELCSPTAGNIIGAKPGGRGVIQIDITPAWLSWGVSDYG